MSILDLNTSWYIKFTLPVYSWLMNRIYQLVYFRRRKAALEDMEITIANLKRDLEEAKNFPVKVDYPENMAVSQFMRTFKYEDSFFHFKPDILTYFECKHTGHCYWSSAAAVWAYEQLGMKAYIYILTRPKGTSHAVCVPATNSIVISNGECESLKDKFILNVVKGGYTAVWNSIGQKIWER